MNYRLVNQRPAAYPAGRASDLDILVLTASTGAGHDSVAFALRQAVGALAPGTAVHIQHPLTGSGPLSPARLYNALIMHAPWLWGLCYRATNRAWGARVVAAASERLWAGGLRSAITARRPALLVSVHPLCTHVAAGILRTVPDPPPLHCVVTDLVTVHRCWASPAVQMFYVPTDEAAAALRGLDVAADRITVTGLPLRAAFAQEPAPPMGGGHPRVLLFGGGLAARWVETVARALLSLPTPVQLLVVCGRNERLRHRLNRALGTRATVLGWCDDVATLMRWSHLVVTKGGPTTIGETLSQARPLVIAHALPGQEVGNIALVSSMGAGCHLPDAGAVVRRIAAGAGAWPAIDAQRASWWGGAAHRVARALLAARADRPASLLDRLPPGKLIVNPVSGEHVVVRASGTETGGRLFAFDLFLPPGARVPACHAHPHQEETFTVVEGRMRFRLGRGRSILAGPGDSVRVPPRTAHWFGNAGPGVAHARVEARPALRMEAMFESAATMGVARYLPGARTPRLSELAVFLREFQQEVAVPHVPAPLVQGILAPLARMARRPAHSAGR